jgi:intein/homing endonuclease
MRHTFSYVEDGYVWYSIAKIEPINKAQIKFVQPIETKIKNTLSDHKIQYEISYTLEKEANNIHDPFYVYNLAVADDESYTANGIAVHNCSNF